MPPSPLPPPRRPQLSQVRGDLERIQARLRAQQAATAAWEASRPSSASLPLPIPPPVNHVEQAKKWATIISLVGGAIVSLVINYQQQRAAALRTPAAPKATPDVVLEAPVINPTTPIPK